MNAKAEILARLRAAKRETTALPELPTFATADAGNAVVTPLVERFCTQLEGMGGQWLRFESLQAVNEFVSERHGSGAIVCSAVADLPGTRVLTAQTPPASLADVELGIVRARYGVAETGSVWLSETEYCVNALGYLAQHLLVLLDPAAIVAGIQDIYRLPDFSQASYAALVTGPSATADIEGILIRGAQGVRSLTVGLLPAQVLPAGAGDR